MNPSMKGSLLFMAVLTILAVSAEAQGHGPPISQWCKTAIYKELCTQQVKGATTWEDAVKNAFESTYQVNIKLQKMLPAVIKAAGGPSKDIIAKICKEEFQALGSNYDEAMKHFAKDGPLSIDTYLFSTNIVDCQEGFLSSDTQMPPGVNKAFDELLWHLDSTLAVLKQN